jgi:hypothetical protein
MLSSDHENIPGHTQYCVEKESKEMESYLFTFTSSQYNVKL